MRKYSKETKRLLREWMIESYERELNRELKKLELSFEEWRQGQISNGELSYRIHVYETGPSRELYKKYNQGDDDMNVAYAIVSGILEKDEVPVELIEALAGPLSFFQSLKDRGDLKLPR